MNRTCGDQQRTTSRWVLQLPLDFKLHLTFQYQDQLVGRMHKIFPALAGPIRPELTTEAAGSPVRSNLLAIQHACHFRDR